MRSLFIVVVVVVDFAQIHLMAELTASLFKKQVWNEISRWLIRLALDQSWAENGFKVLYINIDRYGRSKI